VLAVAWAIGLVVLTNVIEPGNVADALVFIAIFAIIAIGYDGLVGITGQLALGQNGLVALGGYAAGLVALHVSPEPALSAVVGAAAGAIGGVLTGIIAFRLREFYFAIFTLASGVLIGLVALAWREVTGGATGLGPIPGMLGGTIVVPNYQAWMILTGVSLGVVLIVGLNVRDSKTGRIWRTIARDEQLAKAFGIDTFFYKLLAFAFSGLLAGYGGFLMARYTQFLSPDIFGLGLALRLILIVFLGGRGSIWGACVGSAVIFGLTRSFRERGDLAEIVLGAVFIAVLVVMPMGLAGGARQLQRAWLRRRPTNVGAP
jgi:branched-chain amino acid transport system permease protein